MTKDNWIKALREWIKTQHGSAGWEQKLENFISQVEKEAIEKTNKRWRLKKLEEWFDLGIDNAGIPEYHLCYKLEKDNEAHMIVAKRMGRSNCDNCKINDRILSDLLEDKK